MKSKPLLLTNSQWDPWLFYDELDLAFDALFLGAIPQPEVVFDTKLECYRLYWENRT